MKLSLTSAVAILAITTTALPYSVNETPEFVARSELENRAPSCSVAITDRLIFSVSIDTFLKARQARIPPGCIWSSDSCTWAPDKPIGFNFVPSCQRHDFGYRNTKVQKRFTRAMRKKIDDNFKKDLYKYCSRISWWLFWKRFECRRLADVYYLGVRKFGKWDEGISEFDDKPGEIIQRDETPVKNIELDPDIPGQKIPDVLENDGEDIPLTSFLPTQSNPFCQGYVKFSGFMRYL